MIIKYEQEGWEIKNYDYPNQLEIDIQTKLFFMNVIKEKNWFGTIIPDWNQVTFEKVSMSNNIVTNYSEYIDKLECQKMDDNIEITLHMARYYYLMPYGLVDYLSILKDSGRVETEDVGERVETKISRALHFNVDGSYSSNLIYLVIKKVMEKGIPTIDEWEKDNS
ncbi:hypothetical protein JZO77_23975 [Enterococcus hulanensis]|uniref:hypothetical protein n=1 Tax=Enterococcus hulanensis TaxID=2559929 RepID=UPI001A9086C0|nr:hypothetical protein [Enterococcus hulanensis]MBO0459799.1 hypothetical protein [Enterococcus hulanensis]